MSQPFCRDCQRLRLSANGKIYTCLFAPEGHDLRAILRSGADPRWIEHTVRSVWEARADRYSEERGSAGRSKANELPGRLAGRSRSGRGLTRNCPENSLNAMAAGGPAHPSARKKTSSAPYPPFLWIPNDKT